MITIKLDFEDVLRHGGVRQAIEAYCENSDEVACGVVGTAFSTSGPGSGWSVNHGATDFAARAIDPDHGALYYLDVDDGRLATAAHGYDDDGSWDGEVSWSDDSVVCLECPDWDEIDTPSRIAVAVEMAKAVRDTHGAESDGKAWAELVRRIKDAAEAFVDIDADDLE